VYVPDLIQPIWGLHDIYHASFNLNEILGPITGRFPLVDFLSMYSNFFELLYGALGAFGPISSYPLIFALLYLSAVSLLTIGLSVATIMILLPKGQKWLAVLLIIPLVLVGSQDLSSQWDTIMASFSNIPGRMFFPVLLGFLLTLSRFRLSAVIDMIVAGNIIGIAVLTTWNPELP
jgi:hypothetical protein